MVERESLFAGALCSFMVAEISTTLDTFESVTEDRMLETGSVQP